MVYVPMHGNIPLVPGLGYETATDAWAHCKMHARIMDRSIAEDDYNVLRMEVLGSFEEYVAQVAKE